jgi:hypothetical protein
MSYQASPIDQTWSAPMRLEPFTLAFLMIAAFGLSEYASAQSNSAGTASGTPELQTPEKCGATTKLYNQQQLLALTLNRPPGSKYVPLLLTAEGRTPLRPETVPGRTGSEPVQSQIAAASGTWIKVTLAREGIHSDDWSRIYTFGAAQTEENPKQQVPIGIYLRERRADQDVFDVKVPENSSPFRVAVWHIVARSQPSQGAKRRAGSQSL